MGLTIDVLNVRKPAYVTCDSCGHPILGRVHVDPANEVRDYERFSHADGCPDRAQEPLAKTAPADGR